MRSPFLTVFMFAIWLAPTAALACGGLFVQAQDNALADGNGFEMAISATSQETVIWDRITWSGDAANFAWILPVPATPTAVELASEQFFSHLRAETYPQVYAPEQDADDGVSFGCAGAAGDSMRVGGGPHHVDVLSEGSVGSYDYVVLKASGGQSVLAWLKSNGFAVPVDGASLLQIYVDKGWAFLAMRLKPGANVNGARPLRVTLPGRHATLPLQLMRNSPNTPLDITIWAFGDKAYAAKNYDSAKVDGSELQWLTDLYRSTYPEVLRQTVKDAGGAAFVTEYSATWRDVTWSGSDMSADLAAVRKGWPNALRVTRLATRIDPARLSADLELVEAANQAMFRTEFHLTKEQKAWGSKKASTFGLLGLSLLMLGLRRRRS